MSKAARALLACVSVLWAVGVTTSVAFADGSSVSPTRLVFPQSRVSQVITITNAGTTPRRYSVAAYAWDEADANPIALADTNDVVFFPGSFTVGPFQSQRIRVGTVNVTSQIERTYRIVVTELPPLQGVLAQENVGLAFTTGFSIPIYVLPLIPRASADVGGAAVDRDALRVLIRNTGNVHFVAKRMQVDAVGDAGRVAFNESSSWFVLAARQRAFTVAIPRGSCAAIKSVSITVDAGSFRFEQTVIPERSCG